MRVFLSFVVGIIAAQFIPPGCINRTIGVAQVMWNGGPVPCPPGAVPCPSGPFGTTQQAQPAPGYTLMTVDSLREWADNSAAFGGRTTNYGFVANNIVYPVSRSTVAGMKQGHQYRVWFDGDAVERVEYAGPGPVTSRVEQIPQGIPIPYEPVQIRAR